MKGRVLYLGFVLASLAILASCKKKQEEPKAANTPSSSCISNFNIDTFLIENFLFNVGSYWIYKDSINNTIDSCYNLGQEKKIAYYPGFHCLIYYRYAYNNITSTQPQYKLYITKQNIYMMGHAPWSMYLGSYANNSLGTPINNYQEGSLLFDSVFRFTFKGIGPYDPNVVPQDSAHVYLKPKVGIIRTEYYQSGQKQTYTLLNYHIQ